MIAFKRHLVKKILKNQPDVEILFPLTKDYWFYKRQSRAIIKQTFDQFLDFLERHDIFNDSDSLFKIGDT